MMRKPIMSDSCSRAIDLRSILVAIDHGDLTRAETLASMPLPLSFSASSFLIAAMVSANSAFISSRRVVMAL